MKSGTIRYVGYMWVVHCEDVGIMLILPPETSHILSVLPLHNSTLVFSGRQFCLAAHFPHESTANLSHELLIANLVPNKLVAAVPTPGRRHGYYIDERISSFFLS